MLILRYETYISILCYPLDMILVKYFVPNGDDSKLLTSSFQLHKFNNNRTYSILMFRISKYHFKLIKLKAMNLTNTFILGEFFYDDEHANGFMPS